MGRNGGIHHDRSDRCLYRARRTRSNIRIPSSYVRFQSPTAEPTDIEVSKTYKAPEPSLVKLVGKRTSASAGTGSGFKVNWNPRRGETNRVGDSE